jgi:hypothetical protein
MVWQVAINLNCWFIAHCSSSNYREVGFFWSKKKTVEKRKKWRKKKTLNKNNLINWCHAYVFGASMSLSREKNFCCSLWKHTWQISTAHFFVWNIVLFQPSSRSHMNKFFKPIKKIVYLLFFETRKFRVFRFFGTNYSSLVELVICAINYLV